MPNALSEHPPRVTRQRDWIWRGLGAVIAALGVVGFLYFVALYSEHLGTGPVVLPTSEPKVAQGDHIPWSAGCRMATVS